MTWRTILYCTAIFSYGTDNKKPSFCDECCSMYIHKYTYIYIFWVYVDNTHLLIHTSLYMVHISFTGIPTEIPRNVSLQTSFPCNFTKRVFYVLPRMVSFNSGLSASMAMVAYYPRLCGIFGFPLLLLLMAPRSWRCWRWWAEFPWFFLGFGEPKMEDYSLSHNHGSGKYLYLKGNYYWRDPFLTSMIMGGSVPVGFFLLYWNIRWRNVYCWI